MLGLLTERAAKTLAFYYMELQPSLSDWLHKYIRANPIPRDGNWDDVSGDTFLRDMLASPMSTTHTAGREGLFENTPIYSVDPRSLASRIMEIRVQLANEFIQDLKFIADDNKFLQLEALQAAFLNTAAAELPVATGSGAGAGGRPEALPLTGRRAEEEARHRTRAQPKKKKPVRVNSAPPNWRMRVEVEDQVHGPGGIMDGAINVEAAVIPDSVVKGTQKMPSALPPLPPDAVVAAAPAQPQAAPAGEAPAPASAPSASASPPAPAPAPAPLPQQQEGLVPPATKPPASVPTAAAAAAAAGAAAAAVPPPPPLHPELAELLPSIRTNPKGLTPEVAEMLSNAATMSNGALHPEILDALRSAVAGGAVLHPEVQELLGTSLQVLAREAPAPERLKDISEEIIINSDDE